MGLDKTKEVCYSLKCKLKKGENIKNKRFVTFTYRREVAL